MFHVGFLFFFVTALDKLGAAHCDGEPTDRRVLLHYTPQIANLSLSTISSRLSMVETGRY